MFQSYIQVQLLKNVWYLLSKLQALYIIVVCYHFHTLMVQWFAELLSYSSTVVFHTFAGYTPKHCNHNVVNTGYTISILVGSVMIVSKN